VIGLLWPWAFALLPLPLLLRALLPAAQQRGGALRVPFFAQVDAGREQTAGVAGLWRQSLAWLVWLLLLLATAQPQWRGEPLSLPVSGRDMMLAVDISGSMEKADLAQRGRRTTRLAVVKQVAQAFLARREGDRLGLILFGSQAYLQTPLTFDRVTTATLLSEAEIGLAGKETALGDAIGLAVKRLRGSGEQHRVLILLTDGANTAGEVDPRQAARVAAENGIRIHSVGVGADNMASSSLVFGGRRVNPSADLDEDTLRYIAETTGGSYFRARDAKGLEQVYAQLDEIEPTVREQRILRPISSLYYWPLGAALLLSVLLALRFAF